MKVLWRALLVLMILAFTLVIAAPLTSSGTRQLLQLVQRYTPLQIEYRSGTLVSGLELEHLVYNSDSVRVEVVDARAALRLACLWRSTFCFEHLEAASTRVSWSGGEWRQGAAKLDLRLGASFIEVNSAIVDGAVLELWGDDNAQPASDAPLILPAIDLPLDLSVDELLLHQPRWNIYGAEASHRELLLRGQWKRTRLEIAELRTFVPDLGSVTLDGEISFRDDWPLQAQLEASFSDPRVPEQLREQLVNLVVSGSLENLELEAGIAGEPGAGLPALKLQGELAALDPQLPFQAWLQASGTQATSVGELVALPPQLEGLALELPWRGMVSGTVQRQSFELQGKLLGAGYPRLQLDLAGGHSEGILQFDKLRLHDAVGDSELDARGELSLADTVSLSLALSSGGMTLPTFSDSLSGRLAGDLSLVLQVDGQDWQLAVSDIAVEGEINKQPATAAGVLLVDQDGSIRGSDLRAEINNARLNLRAPDAEAAMLSVDIGDLAPWLEGARGQLQLHARIAPEFRDLDFDGELRAFQLGQLDIEEARIAGRYDRGHDGKFALSLDAPGLVAGGLELAQLSLSASGDQQQQALRLSTGGDISGELLLEGSGWGKRWQGRISPTSLDTPQGAWQLQNPLALQWQPDSGQLRVDNHCWRSESAAVCLQDAFAGSESQGQLELEGELAALNFLMPRGMTLEGTVSGQFAGQYSADTGPLLTGSAEFSGVTVTRYYGDGESATARWERGFVETSYDQQGLSLQSSLQREQRRVLELALTLPREQEQALQGRVAIDRIQLGPLIAFAPALSILQGELSGELELYGSAGAPRARGLLRLEQGALVLVANPTPLQQVQLSLELSGEGGKLEGEALLGGGPVRLAGDLQWRQGLRLQLQVEGERQNVLYPPATEMLLSEKLEIVAAPGLLQVKGDVIIHEGSLEPEVLPEGSVAVSTDIVEVDYAGNVIREQLPFDIDMDINVVVENRFHIRSNLVVATLGGQLRLLQRPGRPLQLFGSLSVISGEVRAYQQQLVIQRGTLAFSGRPDNPSINLRAVRNISGSNIVVGMQVLGTYDALRLEMFSEPPMPQGEMMSYLIRGRGLDASAGEDSTALALSVASGVMNQTALVEELNRIPGVSNVSFGSEGNAEDTAATLSGYIGERIYLSYGIGVYEPINVLIARLYLRTRLWLEVVSRLENSVDLYYAFDID